MTSDEKSPRCWAASRTPCALSNVFAWPSYSEVSDQWGLDIASQLALLGLSPNSDTTIDLYREDADLPDDLDLMERVGNLLGMHKSLRVLFPHNRELAYQWPTTPNRAFDNRSPVEIMVEQGLPGILAIRRYLDDKLDQ